MGVTDTVKIHRVHNESLAMTIPRQVAKEAGIQKGDKVRVKFSNGAIIVKRI